MTPEDRQRFERMDGAISSMRADMATVVQKIDNLVELRLANGLLTKTHLEQLHDRCDDRFATVSKELAELETSGRRNASTLDKIRGMGVPVAICISVVAIILGVFT